MCSWGRVEGARRRYVAHRTRPSPNPGVGRRGDYADTGTASTSCITSTTAASSRALKSTPSWLGAYLCAVDHSNPMCSQAASAIA